MAMSDKQKWQTFKKLSHVKKERWFLKFSGNVEEGLLEPTEI